MNWLDVFFKQFLIVLLVKICVVELFVLKGFCTKNDSTTSKLEYVNNLLQELFNTLTNKNLELLDDELWPQNYASEFIQQGPFEYDFIVIGAGTAGSVVASRLSEDPSVNVLVLEAGGNPPPQSEIHTISLTLLNTPYTWNDYAEPNPSCCQAMKGERCYWPRGRMIGGTGGINGNNFLTGIAEDFEEWQQQGNQGWSWNDVYPFYEKATTHIKNKTWPIGSLILNHFQRLDNYQTLKDLMINGTNEVKEMSEIKNSLYLDNILATVDRGKRMSTGKTYLGRVAAKRPNLKVLKYTVATKILFQNGNKASEVEFVIDKAKTFRAKAKKEIIISAGTFNSPKLLMLSGVGPSEHLKNVRIPLIKDLQVGQNLQDHGMMPLILKFTKNVPETSDDITIHSLYEYLMFQKGPLASNPVLVGLINTLRQTIYTADIMLVTHLSKPTKYSNVFEFLQFKDDIVQKFLQQVENQTILEIEGLIIKTKSRGFITLKSNDPKQGPLIYSNLASAEEDQRILLRFIRFVQELIKTFTFRYYGLELITIPLEECDQFSFDSNDYWLCYIRYFYISAWHAVGTCRMGPTSDPSAVTDDHLRVHGITGLRVVDASIMPNITSGNTNGATIMIAEKAARLIRDDWFNNTIS